MNEQKNKLSEKLMENIEINKQIHERIMDAGCWHEVETGKAIASTPNWSMTTSPKCRKCGLFNVKNPNYCESISDAWRVVDKMQDLGFDWNASFYHQYNECYVFVFRKNGVSVNEREFQTFLPKAICLAALGTLEIKL